MMQSQEGVFFTHKWCYLLTCSYSLLYPQRLFAFLKRFRACHTMENLTLSICLNTKLYWIDMERKIRILSTKVGDSPIYIIVRSTRISKILQEIINRYTLYDCCVYAIRYNPKRKTEVMQWKV